MREIKFRAYDKEEKEYYYNAEHTYDFFCSARGCYAESFGEVLNQPERYIVEQFTGLLDRNGKEIYEGDILQDSKGECCRVEWNEKEAHFGLSVGRQFELTDFVWMRGEDVEVIGNIHENPELWGGEE